MSRRWRVLLTEEIHPVGRRFLGDRADAWVAPDVDEATLCREAAEADAIVVRARGTIGRSVMEGAPKLKVIGRHGVGVNNIDVDEATSRNIQVVYTPEANAQSVAEHTVACLLALAKLLPQADRAVRSGDWELRNRVLTTELAGRTLGVVGMGRVGQKVARIMHSIGMRIVYFDVVTCPDVEHVIGAERMELDALLKVSDAVTLHAPLLPSTRHLIGRRELERLPHGALLINAARGELVDEAALVEALDSGQLAGAALDVFHEEPPPPDDPLLRSDRILLTPHSAALTEAAMRRMAMVVEDVIGILEGQPPRYPVNAPRRGGLGAVR